MSHYEERLEKDLIDIREQVAIMAGLVETAVQNAMHALQTGNSKYLQITRSTAPCGTSTSYVINSLPRICRVQVICGCCLP
jgi:hypothetical protein